MSVVENRCMTTSVFDLFTIGIGPSSSHTVGPMRAAAMFARTVAAEFPEPTAVRVELFGSLGATGYGHGSIPAVLLGLEGEDPETVATERIRPRAAAIHEARTLNLLGNPQLPIAFDPETDLVLHRRQQLPFHSNAMRFLAQDALGREIVRTYYSVGGGFVVAEDRDGTPRLASDPTEVPYPFRTGTDLLEICEREDLRIAEVMLANECARRSEADVRERLLRIWCTMRECVTAGMNTSGLLPGGLQVRRRAADLHARLCADRDNGSLDPMIALDWVQLWALAVNEENAAGGRVVTAPTNGAAGILPAVLHYVVEFIAGENDDAVCDFLLTAGAIAAIYHQTASISGAEVGCQGEVGTASSMAAAALADAMGASARQACCAAEIAMEHHLGLTCDPVGGLVQIPCIERNAIGATKALAAARLAMRGDGTQVVSLDQVIKTMMETGADMKVKYKETARGGLAVNVVEC